MAVVNGLVPRCAKIPAHRFALHLWFASFVVTVLMALLAVSSRAADSYPDVPDRLFRVGLLHWGQLKEEADGRRMKVDQRQKLFDADPDLFLSVDIAKFELVMQTRIETGAKSSRRVGSTGQRELAIIQWRKGEGPQPGLDPAKQFTSDDDVTNLTDSPDLLADEKVNGVKAEEAFRRLTRERYHNELDPKDIQTEFLSPTKAWAVFKSQNPGAIPPPPDYLYAWTASNPEKYKDPFGVYMLDVWGYDKGMVTQDVRDPLNTTKLISEVYGRPSSPPTSGMFAYIADNYRQIYDIVELRLQRTGPALQLVAHRHCGWRVSSDLAA